MKIPESEIKWIAGLSNGETLVEGKGKVARIKGEDSPWLKLQAYLKESGLKIHSFGLWINDRHYNLPSILPKFGGEVPLEYNCFRRYAEDSMCGGGNIEHYICAEAVYEKYRMQLWINENDHGKCWIDLKVK